MPLPCLWTLEEDAELRRLVHVWGTNWTTIARELRTKCSKQCRRRWVTLKSAHTMRKGPWSKHEDDQLIKGYQKWGNSWTKIAALIGGRTDNAVKNRFAALAEAGLVRRKRGRGPRGGRRADSGCDSLGPYSDDDEDGCCSDETDGEDEGMSTESTEAGHAADQRRAGEQQGERQPPGEPLGEWQQERQHPPRRQPRASRDGFGAAQREWTPSPARAGSAGGQQWTPSPAHGGGSRGGGLALQFSSRPPRWSSLSSGAFEDQPPLGLGPAFGRGSSAAGGGGLLASEAGLEGQPSEGLSGMDELLQLLLTSMASVPSIAAAAAAEVAAEANQASAGGAAAEQEPDGATTVPPAEAPELPPAPPGAHLVPLSAPPAPSPPRHPTTVKGAADGPAPMEVSPPEVVPAPDYRLACCGINPLPPGHPASSGLDGGAQPDAGGDGATTPGGAAPPTAAPPEAAAAVAAAAAQQALGAKEALAAAGAACGLGPAELQLLVSLLSPVFGGGDRPGAAAAGLERDAAA
ncbi:hypothetical protein Rsub_09759 [Raphidocelis subcapitata]|uniref:Uncharacterized protein n=1 Tax=Raphidocelis subcapitata TaxID=307507 RepID=A0A2V0PCX4_9CHLO|nr:hypothetical protein Rsub_09759 [Raphidocelis subcapitata]|eukprot:GBF97701.1 hypothetical protein Rsub_09759 [Raphidocelis subcapitata]